MKADGDAVGIPVAMGFDPFLAPAMLLTIRDGHGAVVVGYAVERVIIRSEMVVGQAVPQGAETVD